MIVNISDICYKLRSGNYNQLSGGFRLCLDRSARKGTFTTRESGSSPQIGNLAGQQWNVAGVTPPGAFRKMNSDNNVCSTLTSNIMNEYDYDLLLDMYRFMQVKQAMKLCR